MWQKWKAGSSKMADKPGSLEWWEHKMKDRVGAEKENRKEKKEKRKRGEDKRKVGWPTPNDAVQREIEQFTNREWFRRGGGEKTKEGGEKENGGVRFF